MVWHLRDRTVGVRAIEDPAVLLVGGAPVLRALEDGFALLQQRLNPLVAVRALEQLLEQFALERDAFGERAGGVQVHGDPVRSAVRLHLLRRILQSLVRPYPANLCAARRRRTYRGRGHQSQRMGRVLRVLLQFLRLRANLVRQETLAEIARKLNLGEYLRLGEGELKSGGFRRPSILADALEALFGAVFLDGGFDRAREAILGLYELYFANLDPHQSGKDAKTTLQEFLQGRRMALPQYRLRATRGEAHAQVFEVECWVADLGISAVGIGLSRRSAEQEAAKRAYEQADTK